ncbi:MAG: type II toxin-antitoxin system VapC family toxin [Deltaproteobacteria bacterium]|nr:type II toxin-antitoxin system VapC family toxin [Deltaproteobacteria bacterium]
MIYIDTHIAVWLYAGQVEKLTEIAKELLNENEIYISAVVRLELQYLNEIERITDGANEIVSDLSNRIGLKICDKSFNSIINYSMDLVWTRDPFDRIIVANAALNNDPLVTKDRKILDHYEKALC